jgi:DNA-binding transcriptional MerR regulator
VIRRIQQIHPSGIPSSLRFREREGLIEPTRIPGSYLLYSQGEIQQIVQIKRCQNQRL